MSTETEHAEPITGSRDLPWGKEFVWGPVVMVHQIGGIAVVEYKDDKSNLPVSSQGNHGEHMYHPVLINDQTMQPLRYPEDGQRGDLGHSFESLDEAITYAIIIRRVGDPNEARYTQIMFDRMTRLAEQD